MKYLCLLLLLLAVPASAQTTVNVLRFYVYDETDTEKAGPINTAISDTSAFCSKTAPTTPQKTVNPTELWIEDPFHQGMACVVPIPALADGLNYTIKVMFEAPSCFDSYNSKILQPCEGSRATTIPFIVAALTSLPSAPKVLGFW